MSQQVKCERINIKVKETLSKEGVYYWDGVAYAAGQAVADTFSSTLTATVMGVMAAVGKKSWATHLRWSDCEIEFEDREGNVAAHTLTSFVFEDARPRWSAARDIPRCPHCHQIATCQAMSNSPHGFRAQVSCQGFCETAGPASREHSREEAIKKAVYGWERMGLAVKHWKPTKDQVPGHWKNQQ